MTAGHGVEHPDRDAQFNYISDRVKEALVAGQPAISVDTKKKELVGDFKNAGRERHPQGSPEEVRVHDFVIPELGRAVPYGIYDIADDAGWVRSASIMIWQPSLPTPSAAGGSSWDEALSQRQQPV